ncbi:L-aspartate oxidase [Candidatus Lokiarchaeum ossiferum]|uniref:L-aspartate oxidase n=1 Tax=Candidatus Lokiarchaeum ossiferum TaxID=2951803 RepID=UPI00352C4792
MVEKTDYLIIGGGIAGLSAAISLQKYGNVLILMKRKHNDCNTYYAAGGIAGSGPWSADFEGHISDTLEAGDGLCDPDVVRSIIHKGTSCLQDLMGWGIEFDRDEEGILDLGREGGHHTRRVLHTNDLTGRSILQTLLHKAHSFPNIEFREDHVVVNLIERETQCVGAYVLDKKTTEIYTIEAKATVLATGGIGKVYLYTSNPDVASGDGIAMASRIGARINNMEMVQFHPTCLYHPMAKNALITEAIRGEGAILRDQRGKRFMEGIHPLKELAPRDIVARAIDSVLKESGDDFVYLDISFKDAAFLKKRFPGVYQKCLEFNIDITKEPIPVVPACHYACGGIEATIEGKTSVKRLFAIGECACTGLHGANRLASNSLLEGLVCGSECGEYIGNNIQNFHVLHSSLPEWSTYGAVDSKEAFVISFNWAEIRQTMQNYASIIRSDSYLLRARHRITLIHEEVDHYYWNFRINSDLIELRNLLTVARLIVESALARKESRGAHYTLDHPKKSNVVRNTTIQRYW